MLFADRKIGQKESVLSWKKPFESVQHALHAVVSCSLCLALVLTMSGCSDDSVVSDKHTPAQVKVQVNENDCQENDTAADALNMDDDILNPMNYSSREEFIEKTGPYIAQLCNAANFRYPSILYAQMFWEGGVTYSNGQCQVSNIAQKDHALFGIKAAGENQDEWKYWDGGDGSAHSDGGNARAYSSFKNSILDYIDWLIRNKGNGTSSTNGKTYASYAHGANDGSSGREGLSILLMMGYCASGDYSSDAFSTASNLTSVDEKVSISGEPIRLDQANISANSAKSPTSSVSSSSGELIGSDTAEKVWNFFKAEGFSDEATAGILGNMDGESSVDPTSIQGNGAGPAAGIVQWENWSKKEGRWKGMADYAASKGKDWTDLQCQLEYILNGSGELEDSLKTYSQSNCGKYYDLAAFKALTDVDEATEVFEKCFERAGIPRLENRKSKAREYYERFKGTAANNKTETSDACSDGEKQRYNSSGIANGEEYAQIQGRHYDGGKESTENIDTGAQSSACGATSFAVGVNMLLGEVHKYCGVEVWKAMNSDSTTIGWDSGRTKASDWLKNEGLDTQIEVTGINDISNKEELKKKLEEGNVCVVSSGKATVFKNADGSKRYSNGHYVLFYKYENGSFYVNDCGSSRAGGGIEYTEDDVNDYFNAPGRAGGSCSIKRK